MPGNPRHDETCLDDSGKTRPQIDFRLHPSAESYIRGRYGRRVFEGCAAIVSLSAFGTPGRVSGTRELLVHPSYLMVYDVIDDIVRILAIIHTARQWPLE
jgi:plasmid stabilization system protein ParE